jgi:glycogen(starch) synthase
MKILFWSDSFWPQIGGVQVLGMALLRALRARGHDCLIVTRQDTIDLPSRDEYSGMPVYRFPFIGTLQQGDVAGLVRLRQRLAAVKAEFRADVIHLYQPGPAGFLHLMTADVHPAPVVVTLHGAFPESALESHAIRGRLLRSAQWITTCSAAILADTRARLPEVTDRTSVILNSLEPPALARAPMDFAAPRLLCVGRVVPQKGFDLAVDALARLTARFPKARLLIAGDGESRPELERQVEALGIETKVDFLGWVDPSRIAALINTSSIVVMPSRFEPFGLVALEAAQMGRPVIASRIDGLPEIVVHGETGLLVPVEDSGALADGIDHLLNRPELACRMGEAARQRATDLFDWDRHVDGYESVYRMVVRGRAIHAPTCRA